MRSAVAALLVVLLGMALPALAQTTTTGSLQGTVKDPKGAVIPAVTVVVSSDVLIGRQAHTTTNERGAYRFPSLPPGTYLVEAQFAGFNPVKEEVRIRMGQAMSLNLNMQVADVKEEVTVTSKAPVVSTISNTVSTNFDQTYIKKQPLPNNYYNVIKTAPGVNLDYTGSSGSAMLAYGGTSESQNAFTLDGVNVADAGAGQHWVLPAIQWMQEIEVGGLGANAEYGGYTGGVINGITKSGGNTFGGEFEYQYQPTSWTSNNNPDPTAVQEFKYSDVALTLGGPVVKDKLWYFASGELWRQVTTPFGAEANSDRKIPRFLGKLTWQASTSNKLTTMLEYDSVDNERRGIGASTLSEASSHQKAPGVTFALHLESFVNANNFFAVKVTGYDGRDDYLPYHGLDTPGHVDDDTGLAFINQDIHEFNHRHIVTLNTSWSLFKDGLFKTNDSHQFKVGAEYEQGASSDTWRRNGGFTYYDSSTSCPGETPEEQIANLRADPTCGRYYIERGYGEYDEMPRYTGYALYGQDTVQIGRLAINAGLRWGKYKAGWESGRGNATVYDSSFFDPRVGASLDVNGNGKTAIKAHWGRYHDKMYSYLFDREISGNSVVPDQDCYWNEETQAYDDCDTPIVQLARMGKVDHPYVDEVLLTFEQQLSPEMMIGLDLSDRRFRNIMTMINVNQDYTPITIHGNPFTGGDMTIWTLNSAPDFVLTTDAGAYRNFRSATVRFEKRHAKGWSLRSSLVWTDLDGNVRKNNGYAPEFRDRNGMINADGNMDYAYSKWEYKLGAAVDLPYGIQASGQYTFLSGWYYTPYVRVRGLDENASLGRDINLLPRGSEQLPDRHVVDLHLSWSTPLKGDMKLTLSLEAFNVLNKSTVLDVYNRWGGYRISTGVWTPADNYNTTYQIENPRQVRAGARLSF